MPVQRFVRTPLILRVSLIALTALQFTACAGASQSSAPRDGDPVAPDAGAMAELVQALGAEFERLDIDPHKVVAAAPSGDANAVFDLLTEIVDIDGPGPLQPTGVRITWTEQCVGDYDQNGLVDIADLTPLAQNLGRKVEYDDPALHYGDGYWPAGDPDGQGAQNWRLARIDGDRNGEINVADVTPIALHWHEQLDGYQVYWWRGGRWSVHSNLEYPDSPVSIERRQAKSGIPGTPLSTRRVKYQIYYQAALTAYEFRVRPYHIAEQSEGPYSDYSGVMGNDPPYAQAWAAPDVGYIPVNVEFKVEHDHDQDGSIVKYEWDWDGNGGYDYASATERVVEHVYEEIPARQPVLRVTDNEGATWVHQIALTLLVPPDDGPRWRFIELGDAGNNRSHFKSGQLAAINRKPAFIYRYEYEFGEDKRTEFKYFVAEDNVGLSWREPKVFFPNNQYEMYINPQLIETRDLPSIAYIGSADMSQTSDIVFRFASDREGTAWWGYEHIVASGQVGDTNLIDANGAPAIAFKRFEGGDTLWYASSVLEEYSLKWNEPVQVSDSSVLVRGPARAGMAGERPVIFCFDYLYNNDDLFIDRNTTKFHFFVADDPQGENWQHTFTHEDWSIWPVGEYAQIGGLPSVVFGQSTEQYSDKVVFMQAQDQQATVWGAPQDVHVPPSGHSYGGEIALSEVQARPAVLFEDQIDYSVFDVYLTQAIDAEGSEWGSPELLWENCSWDLLELIEISGHPCVLLVQFWEAPEVRNEKLVYGVYF